MSEFKYACPVCGQHIKCDSSQAGTQMECPTCFQKIIVPQAPEGEQTFILTGIKVGGERPLPKALDAGPVAPARSTSYSGAIVGVIILLFIAAAVAFVFRGTIFKSAKSPETTQTGVPTNAVSQNAPKPPKKPAPPLPVAPPSNDTNWTLNLKSVAVPADIAAGRIEGHDFVCDHATFAGGTLTLRYGDYNFAINFSGAKPEALAGKTINVTTNAASAARINLHWKEGDQSMRETFTNGYAMILNFGGITNNRINGSIYLCTSDDNKSYLAGTFKADIRKPRPKPQ